MKPFYPFRGKMVELRPFVPEDRDSLFHYLNDPKLFGRKYIPWQMSDFYPLSYKKIDQIIEKWDKGEKEINLAVILQSSRELIGHCQVEWNWDPHSPSISIVISPSFQRKGYGKEVLALLSNYTFMYTPAVNISCWIYEYNEEGILFAKSCGFQAAGHMRRVGIYEGKYFDFVLFDMLRSEWINSKEVK
jgi:RimJ/RimL family protein N-acetyltransferase